MGNIAPTAACNPSSDGANDRTTSAEYAPPERGRRKRPRVLVAPQPVSIDPPVAASGTDAYDQVCHEFSLVFPSAGASRAKTTTTTATAMAWKAAAGDEANEDDDDRDSTTCSSECSQDTVLCDDDESTFACTYRKRAPFSDDRPFSLSARSPFIVSDYLCPCRRCPWYDAIARHVMTSSHLSSRAKRHVTRILQAYSTYNEVAGFRSDMLRVVEACWTQCDGQENEAFEAFVESYESAYANEWL
ncbi:hypothetical protein SDRG_11713 [Saprolegnia diclina VS20]|uniref:Uncharacterized protein n=1 Tax=Saprolegnia diclina (strain VS20) TaxID=1156394 RepID=T0RED7_SAPDV|nr:hypothetical protein SDRG_11713 [Saprolegnia diclina VS20]EQC30658.1 hypothetical protein SDRG_11713 [Saprolegnia diclina VS20]|eukprot:XP_008615984.1 hypothetical protein SDRG_11713 [Saprolegnia diclina VS20]